MNNMLLEVGCKGKSLIISLHGLTWDELYFEALLKDKGDFT